MKTVIFGLILVTFVLTDSQIKVEEEQRQLPQLIKPPKVRRLKLKPHVELFEKVDKLIDKYGLENDLDDSKMRKYFKQLGKRVFRQLRNKMIIRDRVDKAFNDAVEEFKRVTQKYGIEAK